MFLFCVVINCENNNCSTQCFHKWFQCNNYLPLLCCIHLCSTFSWSTKWHYYWLHHQCHNIRNQWNLLLFSNTTSLTVNGLRPFRNYVCIIIAQTNIGESCEQFCVQLKKYLFKWISLSKTVKTFKDFCKCVMKEQFINSCTRDLAIHLCVRGREWLVELTLTAERFFIAHNTQLEAV